MKTHIFSLQTRWTGNRGTGTPAYDGYDRDFTLHAPGKPDWNCSSAPAFLGNAGLYNPEDMLIAALSSCHMLWYLHLCADAGISVLSYTDNASGQMLQIAGGGGHFTEVHLRPEIVIAAGGDLEMAVQLHKMAHEKCFIANSCNFPVHCHPQIKTRE